MRRQVIALVVGIFTVSHLGERLLEDRFISSVTCGDRLSESFRNYGIGFTRKPFRKLVATGLRAGR